jgi:multiple sugar transport system permease protein
MSEDNTMKNKAIVKIFSWTFITLFLAVSLFPFFWVVVTSFKPGAEIFGENAFGVIPENPTLESYRQVIFEKGIPKAIVNSFIVSSLTTAYVIIVSSLSAYIIARYRFKGKVLLMSLVLGVSMFPQMIVVGPIFNMFYKLGILNSYWIILAFSTITLPSAVWIMVAHIKKIPVSIEEAARMDGCGPFRTLWQVVFPIAAPGVFTTAIMTFIAAWNEYLLTYTLNADKMFQTVPVAINALRTQFSILWGEITAATVVVVIPTLIIVLLFQKQIVSGLMSGAVKE